MPGALYEFQAFFIHWRFECSFHELILGLRLQPLAQEAVFMRICLAQFSARLHERIDDFIMSRVHFFVGQGFLRIKIRQREG